jgi:hypothetical protein
MRPSIRKSSAATVVAERRAWSGHPGADIERQLAAVLAVRLHARVRAVRHLEAGANGFPQALHLQVVDDLGLFELVGLEAPRRAPLQHRSVGDRVGDEKRAVLGDQPDRFVVEHRGVLDRAHAGPDRALDALGAVSVRRDVASALAGGVDGGAQLLLAVLRRARIGAGGHDAAGGQHLDPVGAVLDVLPHLGADRFGAVGDRRVAVDVDVGRQVVAVAVAAGRRQRFHRHQQARTRDAPRSDRIAQGNVREVAAAEVAHRREAGLERLTGVGDPFDGGPRRRLRQLAIGGALFAADEVDVDVDEAGEQGETAEVVIDRLAGAPVVDRDDLAARDAHHDVAPEGACRGLEQAVRRDREDPGGSLRLRRHGSGRGGRHRRRGRNAGDAQRGQKRQIRSDVFHGLEHTLSPRHRCPQRRPALAPAPLGRSTRR